MYLSLETHFLDLNQRMQYYTTTTAIKYGRLVNFFYSHFLVDLSTFQTRINDNNNKLIISICICNQAGDHTYIIFFFFFFFSLGGTVVNYGSVGDILVNMCKILDLLDHNDEAQILLGHLIGPIIERAK